MTAARISRFALGLSGIAAGGIPLVVKFASTAPQTVLHDPAPDWVGFLICAMFIAAGLMAIVNALADGSDGPDGDLPRTAPRVLSSVYRLTGVAIAVSLCVLFTWVSIGPGERHFIGFASFGGFGVGGFGVGPVFGRVVFGIGALLMWVLLAAITIRALRSVKKRD